MAKSNDRVMTLTGLKNRKGLSLVELIVVTVVIALAACLAFPVYKIFQQRSKEKRLKKILTDVRAAISGTKSHNSSNDFQEGFRTVARVKGMDDIIATASASGWDKEDEQECISAFIAKIGLGHGYPNSPADIWSSNPQAEMGDIAYKDKHGVDKSYPLGTISLERPFYRSKPIHPFNDWYPTADFEYVPASDTTGKPFGTSYTIASWTQYSTQLMGVKDIVSRGAGVALDGSNTDEW